MLRGSTMPVFDLRQSTACRCVGVAIILIGLLPACGALVVEGDVLVPPAMAGLAIALVPGLALAFTGMVLGLTEPPCERGGEPCFPSCPDCDYDLRGGGERCPECGGLPPSEIMP